MAAPVPECCIVISGAVEPPCCDGPPFEGTFTVERFTNPPGATVCDATTGNIVPTGGVFTGELVDGCFETCPLPVNSAHAPPTYYRIVVRGLNGQVVGTFAPIYVEGDLVECGGVYPVKDFTTAPPEGGNLFCDMVLRCLPVITFVSPDGSIGIGGDDVVDLTTPGPFTVELTGCCVTAADGVLNPDGSVTVTLSQSNGPDVPFVIPADAVCCNTTATVVENADGDYVVTLEQSGGPDVTWIIPGGTPCCNTAMTHEATAGTGLVLTVAQSNGPDVTTTITCAELAEVVPKPVMKGCRIGMPAGRWSVDVATAASGSCYGRDGLDDAYCCPETIVFDCEQTVDVTAIWSVIGKDSTGQVELTMYYSTDGGATYNSLSGGFDNIPPQVGPPTAGMGGEVYVPETRPVTLPPGSYDFCFQVCYDVQGGNTTDTDSVLTIQNGTISLTWIEAECCP